MTSKIESGYVYVISNELFNTRYDHPAGPGIPILKIGNSSYEPTRRSLDGERAFRNRTFLPGPFHVEYAIFCENYREVEKYLHKLFESSRTAVEGYGTEWFIIEKEKIKVVLEGMVIANPRNKWWSEESSNSIEGGEEKVSDVSEERAEKKKKKKTKKMLKKERAAAKRQKIFQEKKEMESAGWLILTYIGKSGKMKDKPQYRYKSPEESKYKGRIFDSYKRAKDAYNILQKDRIDE